jgi:hypothetical protein
MGNVEEHLSLLCDPPELIWGDEEGWQVSLMVL